MWVRVSDKETINVDAKVVKLLKEDLPLPQGNMGYYIGFYESLNRNAEAVYKYQFPIPSDRDDAFEIITAQLETIDIKDR